MCARAFVLVLVCVHVCSALLPSPPFQASVWLGLFIALLWCVSVCLSRVYLGVHAVLVSYNNTNKRTFVISAYHRLLISLIIGLYDFDFEGNACLNNSLTILQCIGTWSVGGV